MCVCVCAGRSGRLQRAARRRLRGEQAACWETQHQGPGTDWTGLLCHTVSLRPHTGLFCDALGFICADLPAEAIETLFLLQKEAVYSVLNSIYSAVTHALMDRLCSLLICVASSPSCVCYKEQRRDNFTLIFTHLKTLKSASDPPELKITIMVIVKFIKSNYEVLLCSYIEATMKNI